MELIDIHAHVVFGVDDGAKSIEDSNNMIQLAVSQGVGTIICTSHVSHHTSSEHTNRYKQNLSTLQNSIKAVKLYSGGEIFYSDGVIEKLQEGIIPTLADSNVVLVEFLPSILYEAILRALMDISEAGYIPLIAHAERYDCLRMEHRLEKLHNEYNFKVQMNSSTVIKSKGIFGDKWIKNLIKNGFIDVIGSDTHNVSSRPCTIMEAYEVIRKITNADIADQLCCMNAQKLLNI